MHRVRSLFTKAVVPFCLVTAFVVDATGSDLGSLIIHLEGKHLDFTLPSLFLNGPERTESILLGPVAIAEGAIRVDGVPAGAYSLDFDPLGSSTDLGSRTLELGIHPGCTTVVRLDLESGRLEVDPVRPDPFGVDESWDAEWIALLPGAGEQAALAAQTSPVMSRQASVDQLDVTGSGFRHRIRLGAESIARSVRIPVGTVTASSEEATRELLARYGDPYADFEGSTGEAGQTAWEGTVARQFTSIPARPRLFGSIRGLKYIDATPSVFEHGNLPHSGLTGLELYTRVDMQLDAATKLTGQIYGEGTRQNFFVESYRNNPRHAPREERAALTAALRATRDAGEGLRLTSELAVQRTFLESGDGTYFDNLAAYERFVNAELTDDNDLYWLEGHTYDYFRRKVQLDVTGRLEVWRNPGSERALGVGGWMRRGTYRSYEHFAPTQGRYTSPNQVHSIGYDLDGESRDDGSGHEPGRPVTFAGFATMRRPVAGGEVEIGLRATHYRPGGDALRDLTQPFGGDSTIAAEDLQEASASTTLDPRVGFTRSIFKNTRLWISGGIETWIPPAQAVYFATDFLNPISYEALFGDGSEVPLGNPDLKPERVASGLTAIATRVTSTLWLRLGVEGRIVRDAITPRAFPVGSDSLIYYTNDGKRDLIDFSIRAHWVPSQRFQARFSYDLSRQRTETVEPVLLDAAWMTPKLPSSGIDQDEGLPILYPTHDDGRNRGWFPSILDRRHRLSLAAISHTPPDLIGEAGEVIFRNLDVGLLARLESGAPFTQSEIYPTGLLDPDLSPTDASGSGINGKRTDWTMRFDLRVARNLRFWGIETQAWFEISNLTNEKNAWSVYTATGEGDDDDYLQWDRLPSEHRTADFTNAYRARIRDPLRYEDPRLFRIGLKVLYR